MNFFKQTKKTRKSLSTDPRKSIRLSSKPSKISYFDLDNEPDSDMQTQNPTKRLKTSSSAFLPYDRKEAQKEKMLEDIVSPVNIKAKMITNPYLTNPAPEVVTRPLCESKSFDFEDMKSRKIMLDKVMNCIGWKTFCELDEVIYPNLVQKFYSSAKVLEGHEIILCEMDQTQVIITTDVLAKVFNLPNSGVKLYGKKWYDKAKVNRNAVIDKIFKNVKPAKDFPVTALKNEFKILHNLCAHSLLPRSRNKYRVNDNDLMILHHLSSGLRVNLLYVIIRHMTTALKDTSGNGGLPYAMALTKIFKEFKLSFIGEKATENQKPFNCKNVSHLKIHEDSEALGIHQVSLPQEAFPMNEEEENPLFNLVNAVIVESHLSSPSASLNVPKYHHHPVTQTVSTDLTLSLEDNVEPTPIPSAPLFHCEDSALFGTTCINRFIHSPKLDDNPLLSDMPPLPSHFSSFDSYKSTGTSPKNDPPVEPPSQTISNDILFSEITALRSDVNNLRESFVSFMFHYFGMMAPAHGKDPGSSSNPPPNQQ